MGTALAIALGWLLTTPASTTMTKLRIVDTISGKSLLAIENAVAVFKRSRSSLDLTKYKVTVVHEGTNVVVMFTATDAAVGARGGSGKVPGFDVTLDARDLRVIEKSFAR